MNIVRRIASAGLAVALVAAGLLAGTPAGVPHAAAAGPNAVTDWSLIAQNAWSVARPAVSGIYVHALVHVAIYDAVVSIEGGAEPFLGAVAVTEPADANAAVAAAARDILVARVPTHAASVESQYAAYLATIPDGEAESNGVAVGQAAAAAVLLDRTGDGLDNVIPWVQPTPGPGVFEPFPSSPPVDVKIPQLRPIALDSASQFRPGPPVALTSPQYTADFNETKALGHIDSTVRTAPQKETARFWSENPFIQWNRTLRETAMAHGLDLSETARFMAMTNVSYADGLIACFDAKYHYVWWRPMHAIQRAGTDGNELTSADPDWRPLLVVNHPEYPSGHGCGSGAVLEAMRSFFGTANVHVTASSTMTGTTRSYDRLQDIHKDIFMARIYGGLHFRSTMGTGFNLGKHVGRFINAENFAPLD